MTQSSPREVTVWFDAHVIETAAQPGPSALTMRISDVLAVTDQRLREGGSAAPRPWATGFSPLDSFLSGGVRPGELVLLAGPQGLGKTTMALQLCRHVLTQGCPVLYVSYEHDAVNLLERLLAAEAGERAGVDAVPLKEVRALLEGDGSAMSLSDKLASTPGGAEALSVVAVDLEHLHVLRGGVATDVAAITAAVAEVTAAEGSPPLVLVDYVQKVSVEPPVDDEEVRMARVAGALKDLALTREVPVVAITASDSAGIAAGSRLRTEHFRGASALAYEADVVLVLNEKYDVVARHHLMYGANNAERFRSYAVLTIEKNRGGMSRVDLQFRKRFEQARFERAGAMVEEQLVDERVFV
jgi:replicative DNA helicase